jgi:Tol biopolymer transport system component
MGKPINTKVYEYCPMVSPDGKYLFFSRFFEGKSDIYWVDSRIIDKYRPKELK